MAYIHLQRRKAPVWALNVGLGIVLIVWALFRSLDTNGVAHDADGDAGNTMTASSIEELPAAVISTAPASFAGEEVAGEAVVAEVVSDRAFWVKDAGERLFVVIDKPTFATMAINAGQTLELRGTVYTLEMFDLLFGILESETRALISGESVLLYVRSENLRIAGETSHATTQQM
jgi:hypothetical protein